MAMDEFFGCLLTSFGIPIVLILFTIIRHPLRIITFIISASFWLVSFLLSSVIWFAVVPLKDKVAFGLVFSVLLQEAARFAFVYCLHKINHGLRQITAEMRSRESSIDRSIVSSNEDGDSRNPIADHRVVDATRSSNPDADKLVTSSDGFSAPEVTETVFNVTAFAFVGGIGFGVAAALFASLNMLVALRGPGTFGLNGEEPDFVDLYAVQTLLVILNHTALHVIMSRGFERRAVLKMVLVVVIHMLYSCLTLANGYPNPVPHAIIGLNTIITVSLGIWAFKEAGGQGSQIPWAIKLNLWRFNRFMSHNYRSRNINRSL